MRPQKLRCPAIMVVPSSLSSVCSLIAKRSLSLSRFITRTIGTIDPMITAENIIVNAYDPLMTMDHSRCQIGRGSNGARACNRGASARANRRELTHAAAMTNAFNVDVNSRYDKSKFKGTARYRIKRARACCGINNATRINFPPDRATMFI